MKSVKFEYDVVVGDKGQAVYSYETRDQARSQLREAKADGFDGYIVQKRFVLAEERQVR